MTDTSPADGGMLDRAALLARARDYLELLRNTDSDGRRDIAAMMAMLHEDITYEIPFLEKPALWRGKSPLEAFFQSMQGVFTDLRYDVGTILVDVESQSVMIEMTSSRLILPDRVPYSNRYAIKLAFHDGLIRELCEYVNPLPAQELSRRLQLT